MILQWVYETSHGEVLINDEINYKNSINEIGFVPQTVFLFDDTIYNNILIGSSNLDNVDNDKINKHNSCYFR